MCRVIKGLADLLFLIRIYSGGIEAAAYEKKMDEICMKAVAFGQKWDEWTKFGFSAELA